MHHHEIGIYLVVVFVCYVTVDWLAAQCSKAQICYENVCLSLCLSHSWSKPKRFKILKCALHSTTEWHL